MVTVAAEKIMPMIRGKHERVMVEIIALWHDAIFKLSI